jgi:hypothetical protein
MKDALISLIYFLTFKLLTQNWSEPMCTKPDYESSISQETYVQLARLAHESFEQRRSYEWKMHFGLWAAIAVVVLAAIKEKIVFFSSVSEAKFIGFILWGIYLLHFVMVSRGHWKDKQKKHFYMDKAEGLPVSGMEEYGTKSFCWQALWAIPYIVFTGFLIYLAINVLLGIQTEGQLA